MIKKNKEKKIENINNLFEGSGSVKIRKILDGPEEMSHKGRVFAHSTLEPGSSIGFHIHENESETYYIYSGKAEFNDNGKIVNLSSGDFTYTAAGEGHGIKNIGDEPLEFIALILND